MLPKFPNFPEAYQVRKNHCDQTNETYEADWSKLPSWGKELVVLNPGSLFDLEQDSNGRFRRMCATVKAPCEIAKLAGINFSGVDSTFFKHMIFREGQLMLLVTRDSNNQLLPLSWCICLKVCSIFP